MGLLTKLGLRSKDAATDSWTPAPVASGVATARSISQRMHSPVPVNFSSTNLSRDVAKALRSRDKSAPADFLGHYNATYAPYLTNEDAAMQNMAQHLAYMRLPVGSTVAFNVRKDIDDCPDETYPREAVVRDSVAGAGGRAHILWPKNESDSVGNRVVIAFNGVGDKRRIGKKTASGITGSRSIEDEVLKHVNAAFLQGRPVTLTGHGLGGTCAARLMSKLNAVNQMSVKLIIFDAPHPDAETAAKIEPKNSGVRCFQTQGDHAPKAGQAEIPARYFQTYSDAWLPTSKHNDISLIRHDLDDVFRPLRKYAKEDSCSLERPSKSVAWGRRYFSGWRDWVAPSRRAAKALAQGPSNSDQAAQQAIFPSQPIVTTPGLHSSPAPIGRRAENESSLSGAASLSGQRLFDSLGLDATSRPQPAASGQATGASQGAAGSSPGRTSHYLADRGSPYLGVINRLGLDVPVKGRTDFPQKRIAVLGAGIMGSAQAIALAHRGYDVTLVDPGTGPLRAGSSKIPAHLYAGSLYFNLGDPTVKACFQDAVAFARWIPAAINRRPTVCAIATHDTLRMAVDDSPRSPEGLRTTLQKLRKLYAEMVAEDPANEVFGDPDDYFTEYSRDDVEALLRGTSAAPNPWMLEWAELANLDLIQWPVFLVNEYGLNMQRAGAALDRELHRLADSPQHRVTLKFGHAAIPKVNIDDSVSLDFEDGADAARDSAEFTYDHVVNCAGARGADIDELLQVSVNRFQHVKVAGVYEHATEEAPVEPPTEARPSDWLPGFSLLGSPMVHFCPTNGSYFVANVTTQDATYVGDAVTRGRRHPEGADALATRLEIAEAERGQRGTNILTGLQTALTVNTATTVATFVGSVDVIGANRDTRSRGGQSAHHRDLSVTSAVHPKASAATLASHNIANHMVFALAGQAPTAVGGCSGDQSHAVDMMEVFLPPGGVYHTPPPISARGLDAGARAQALALNLPSGVGETYRLPRSASAPQTGEASEAHLPRHIQNARQFRARPMVDAVLDAGVSPPSLPMDRLPQRQAPLAVGIDTPAAALAQGRTAQELHDFAQGLAKGGQRIRTWEDLPTDVNGKADDGYAQTFERAAQGARHIHANLDFSPDMLRFVETFGTSGKFALGQFRSPYRDGAADELYRTFRTPNLFAKTTYYFDGKPLSTAHSRRRAWDPAQFEKQGLTAETFDQHRLTLRHGGDASWQAHSLSATLQETVDWATQLGFTAVKRLATELQSGLRTSASWGAEARASAEADLRALVPTLRTEIQRAEAMATDRLNPAFQLFYAQAETGSRNPYARQRRRIVIPRNFRRG